MMEFDYAIYTDRGGQEMNEDYADATRGDRLNIWAAADGLGCHDERETASGMAVQHLMGLYKNGGTFSVDTLRRGISDINALLLEKQKDGGANMRTTLAVAISDGRRLIWTNVGDTRIYYFSHNKKVMVTQDHTVAGSLLRGRGAAATDVRFHEDRNRLLHVLGKPGLKFDAAQLPIQIHPGDAMLLCSDGFWQYVYDAEMETDLLKAAAAQDWLETMLVRNFNRAPKNCDNITAIAVLFR